MAGCTATRCKACKRRVKACELVRAKDGSNCCKYCVATYNLKISV